MFLKLFGEGLRETPDVKQVSIRYLECEILRKTFTTICSILCVRNTLIVCT